MAPVRLYFAHPVSDYGTAYEAAILTTALVYYDVENPNQPHHQEGYKAQGMAWFKAVIQTCEACLFLSFPDGKVGAGVATEVQDFHDRSLPVFEAKTPTLWFPAQLDPDRVLSVEDTRAAVQHYRKRANGGRGRS